MIRIDDFIIIEEKDSEFDGIDGEIDKDSDDNNFCNIYLNNNFFENSDFCTTKNIERSLNDIKLKERKIKKYYKSRKCSNIPKNKIKIKLDCINERIKNNENENKNKSEENSTSKKSLNLSDKDNKPLEDKDIIEFDLNEEKIKTKKVYKLKNKNNLINSSNIILEYDECRKYLDLVPEQINNEKIEKNNIRSITNQTLNISVDDVTSHKKLESFDLKEESLTVEKLIEKLPKDEKSEKNSKSKYYKNKKNETFNLKDENHKNNLMPIIYNINNNSNKKEKYKKDKTEKLEKIEKLEKQEVKNDVENFNSMNTDCIKNIEIPNNNYIKSKKSVYKNCLYCKNDKIYMSETFYHV